METAPPSAHRVTAPSPTLGTPATVLPQPESRLDQLAARHDAARAAAAAAAEQLKAITDAIKAELTTAAPGQPEILLSSPHLARPLQLLAVTAYRLDARRLKAELPETYVRYEKQSTSWRLAPMTG